MNPFDFLQNYEFLSENRNNCHGVASKIWVAYRLIADSLCVEIERTEKTRLTHEVTKVVRGWNGLQNKNTRVMVKVKNLHNTGDRKPKNYTSWKEFWKAKKGYWPNDCSAYDCNGPADVGAHVKKVDSYDNKWYIVPLCSGCNKRTDTFEVSESRLVPVNDND